VTVPAVPSTTTSRSSDPVTHNRGESAIKTLKHLTLATLVVAGLAFPSAITRPQPAWAGNAGTTLCQIVTLGIGCSTPFGEADALSCSVSEVTVGATPDGNRNSYVYDMICDQGTPPVHVVGGFSFDTKTARETLSTDQVTIAATWSCAHDPWIAPSAQPCSPVGKVNISTGSNVSRIPNIDTSPGTLPFSTQYLDDQSRQALFFAQLQYAAAHPPAPAPAPVLVLPLPDSTTNSCSLCGSILAPTSAPAPTLPDFKVTAIRAVDPNQLFTAGMTAGYEVVVANLGTRSQTPVQVSIQITGSAQYSRMTQTPAGFDCSGNGPVLCVGAIGGYGDPIQDTVVIFGLQVMGAKAGVGAISAAADPNGLIKEIGLDPGN
jgi:hypothetical protein